MQTSLSLRHRLRNIAARVLWEAGVTRPKLQPKRLTIVTFHRVLKADTAGNYPFPDLVVSPEVLGDCLAFFSRFFECCTLDEGVRRIRLEIKDVDRSWQ